MRAERKVKAAGQDWTLLMDMNALADFEDEFQESAFAVIASLDDPNGNALPFLKLRRLMHVALRQNHPDATISDAGRVLSENPEVVGELIAEAMPEQDAEGEGDDAPGNGKAPGK